MRTHPFAVGLSDGQVEALVACSRDMPFEAGEFLLREGDHASTFFLVEAGTVALELKGPGKDAVRVETVGAGDALGLSWLFPPFRVHLDARALTAVRTHALDARKLRGMMEADQGLGYELSRRLLRLAYERLERARLQRAEVYRPGER